MGKESRKRKEAKRAREAAPTSSSMVDGVGVSTTTDMPTQTRQKEASPPTEPSESTKDVSQPVQISVEQAVRLLCPISMLGICSQHDGTRLDSNSVMWRTQVHIATGSYGRISVGFIDSFCLNPYFTHLSGRGPRREPGHIELVVFKSPQASTLRDGESVPFKDILPELALLASPLLLYHDNVVDLLGFYWEPLASGNDSQFAPTLILEFTDQGSLKTFFSAGVSIPMGQKIGLCQDICRALRAFHQECTVMGKLMGLHHGDLKPE